MKVLRFIVIFLLAAVTVTIAALTAMFTFWSFLSVQPGTATALAMLFLVAPGLGIVSGIAVTVRTARDLRGGGATQTRWPMVAMAALVGGLAGYGASIAAIDLTYTERWSDPGSVPTWLPFAPMVAGFGLAVLLALLAFLLGRRADAGQRLD